MYIRVEKFDLAIEQVKYAEEVASKLEDEALICDDLTLKARLFVIKEDFEPARQCLLI